MVICFHQGSVLIGYCCISGDMPLGSMKGRGLELEPKGLAGPAGALAAPPKGLTAGLGAPRSWPATPEYNASCSTQH